jgi:Tfp pilus assembly protein PilX
MGQGNKSSQGFTLIAAILILVLLSGVAVGLFYMVTNESRMGGTDLESNLAYYGAESGMEKLTADLSALYTQYQSPLNTQIQALVTPANNPPSAPTAAMVGNMGYQEFITYPVNGSGNPASSFNTVSSGSNQGLYAEIIPMTLQVIATRPSGASINMTRTVEIALIPVFQFGVFCGYDCSYFAGPPFAFGGRVHTNQNLFLASGASLVFDDKISAYQQIIMDQLENGHPTSSGYGGTVYVPKASGGCALSPIPPSGEANCVALPGATTIPGDASWSGGYPTVAGSVNANFPSLSSGTLNGFVVNSLTGAKNMQLPFVQNSCTSNPPPCTDPISIVRKPQVGESAASTLGTSRLYNKATIRVLLADTQLDLHPERGALSDGQDVQFPNSTTFSTAPFTNAAVTLTSGGTEAVGFATANTNGWVAPYTDSGLTTWTTWPLTDELTSNPATPAAMTGPWIRVEYLNNAGTWVGVTKEWLALGFGQPFNLAPIAPGTNGLNPNAILILQQLQPGVAVSAANMALTSTWYPINFYDAREGEMRDNATANATSGNNTYSSCSVQGIMNAVELDVGNLKNWLNGTIAGSGANVNYTNYNGYVLYFSDHRGMLVDPHPSNGGQTAAGVISGESGLEDVVNSAAILTSTTPDGALEAKSYYSYSPEDVDQNGFLDNWGEKNLGYGFGINTNTSPLNGYLRVPNPGPVSSTTKNCAEYNTSVTPIPQASGFTLSANNQVGMANAVSGTRHVLKLVDGGMSAGLVSSLPVMPAASGCSQSAANPTGCGGFTVASENPVYIQGNYNSNGSDPFWGTATAATPTQTPHSAASVIADSVTVLSNSWTDANSLIYPDASGNRSPAAQAYYRTAISAGKSIPFPQPTWTSVAQDFGTDGGMHNFLRYLESWGQTLNYDGSLVSMYYSEYNTGTYKDGPGGDVYSPPPRNYYFDVLFLTPSNLPPATPEFQDIDSLGYHQNFTPQ